MTQLTNYGENKLADFMRGQALTLPASWYLALGSAASDAGVTELVISGLSRAVVPRALASFAGTQAVGSTLASTGTSHASSNNAAIPFGTPAGTGTATHIGFMDAASAGNCWAWFPVASIAIVPGSPDPVQILAGALQFTLGASGGCSDYLANKLIDLIFRGQAFSWPATLYVALFTVAPTSAGGGTEIAGGAYARRSLVPSLLSLSGTQGAGTTAASSGTAGRISNNAALTFPAPTADQGTVVAGGIMDAASSGNLLMRFGTSPRTINNGGTPASFAIDALGITLD